MDINDLIAVGGLVLTLITVGGSIIFSIVNAEKRKYGLERDFAHLKRNYEQNTQNLSLIISELDRRFDAVDKTLIEIKSLLK